MDKVEARQTAVTLLDQLRDERYEDLQVLLEESRRSVVLAPSGVKYQFVAGAVWDSGSPGNLRVLVAVDDGGVRAFAPLSVDFIKAPDGSFVGE